MLYWSDFVELVFCIGLRDFIFVSLKLHQVSKKTLSLTTARQAAA